jgi:nicotinate-nucleotide adenylyltransferase
MVALASANHQELFASDREIRRGGVSYMLDTLRSYVDDEPGVSPVLILGLDAFADLPTWRDPETLAAEFDIVVVSRPGFEQDAIVAKQPSWLARRIVPVAGLVSRAGSDPPQATGGRIALLATPPCPVSASLVRDRLSRGEEIKTLVAPAVGDYIDKYRIYRD